MIRKKEIRRTKLLKKAITLSLCACMIVGMATGASADYSAAFKVNQNNFHLNMVASSVNGIANGTRISTWNSATRDGTQDWTVEYLTGNGDRQVLKAKMKPSKVVSYNRITGQPVLWERNYDNPESEYAMRVWPSASPYTSIEFVDLSGKPKLVADGSQITVGSQYGYYINAKAWFPMDQPKAMWSISQQL